MLKIINNTVLDRTVVSYHLFDFRLNTKWRLLTEGLFCEFRDSKQSVYNQTTPLVYNYTALVSACSETGKTGLTWFPKIKQLIQGAARLQVPVCLLKYYFLFIDLSLGLPILFVHDLPNWTVTKRYIHSQFKVSSKTHFAHYLKLNGITRRYYQRESRMINLQVLLKDSRLGKAR